MKTIQFARVLLHVRFEIDRFEAALRKLASYDYASSEAHDFIRFETEELKAISDAVDITEQDFQLDPDGAGHRLVSIYRVFSNIRASLEVLERARTDEVPWSLIPSTLNLAKEILPGKKVLITTTVHMNYEIMWYEGPSNPFVMIFMPRLHRSNAFLHIALGHELFHPAISAFFTTEISNVMLPIHQVCVKLAAGGSTSHTRFDLLTDEATDCWERAVTELMCDMGCVEIFGPAAIWTLASFASVHPLDGEPSPGQYYPPWRLRLQVALRYLDQCTSGKVLESLLDELKSAGLERYAQAVENVQRETEDWLSQPPDPPVITWQPLTSAVYPIVESSIPRAMGHIARVGQAITANWQATIPQVPFLVKRLAQLVPPSEAPPTSADAPEPGSLTAIVTACWFSEFMKSKPAPTP